MRLWWLGALVGVALAAPWLPLADPLATQVRMALQPPSFAHPFGTDALGRDLLARVVHAARLDLGLAFGGVGLALIGGSLLGAWAGWRGGWWDRLASGLGDVLLTLPVYLLGIALAVAIGNSLWVILWVTALINLPVFLRLTRGEVRRHAAAPWVDAARMAGRSEADILRRAVWPKVRPLIWVQASTTAGWAVLNAAGLSFVGVGVRPPMPEWGIMLSEGSAHLMRGQWWLVVFPALALVGTVLILHRVGEGLRRRWM